MALISMSHDARPALALNVELSHGRLGASARVELHDGGTTGRQAAPPPRIARVALRGCIDAVAARRLSRVLDDLMARGAEQVFVDCGELRHIDYRVVPTLMAAFDRYDASADGVVLCGLSVYLRDLFRAAGCESRLRTWPPAAGLPASAVSKPEPGGERAS